MARAYTDADLGGVRRTCQGRLFWSEAQRERLQGILEDIAALRHIEAYWAAAGAFAEAARARAAELACAPPALGSAEAVETADDLFVWYHRLAWARQNNCGYDVNRLIVQSGVLCDGREYTLTCPQCGNDIFMVAMVPPFPADGGA